MHETTLFQTSCARAETTPSINLVRLTWTNQPSSKGYRATLIALLEELKEGPRRLLLIDERRLINRNSADVEWFKLAMLPALIASGLDKVAMVGDPDGPILGDVTKNDEQPAEVARFENTSQAMLWLMNHGHDESSEVYEEKRLATLKSYRVLDTMAQSSYDDVTRIAAAITEMPIALISLVDEERQWFKSKVGLDATETPRDISFCTHAIETPDTMLVIPDATKDPRFAKNPLVTSEPKIRFYAGAPLVGTNGTAVGTLCVIDRKRRKLNRTQLEALSALSRVVVTQLEYRRLACDLKEMHTDLVQHLSHVSKSGSKVEQTLNRQLEYLLAS